MKQVHLAKKAKISAQHVSDLKRGIRQFTLDMTILFEQVTGIPREKWAFPEKYGDPWEELKDVPETGLINRRSGTDRRNCERRKGERRECDVEAVA